MKILFTTTNLPTSWIIRKLTGEPVSHCAVEFGNYVAHSSFSGTILEYSEDFRRRNKVLFELEMPEIDVIFREKKGYDFGGLLYLALRFLLKKINIRLPKKNLWETTGMYLCTEFITFLLHKEEDSMITPYQLYLNLKKEIKHERLDT